MSTERLKNNGIEKKYLCFTEKFQLVSIEELKEIENHHLNKTEITGADKDLEGC